MKRAPDTERDEFLLKLFRQSDLPEDFAAARRAYRHHMMAQGLVQVAQEGGDSNQTAAAREIAARAAAVWAAHRETFFLYD